MFACLTSSDLVSNEIGVNPACAKSANAQQTSTLENILLCITHASGGITLNVSSMFNPSDLSPDGLPPFLHSAPCHVAPVHLPLFPPFPFRPLFSSPNFFMVCSASNANYLWQ